MISPTYTAKDTATHTIQPKWRFENYPEQVYTKISQDQI